MTKRAGRPRKSGPRKPCGRLVPVNDLGTDELLRHRATLGCNGSEWGAELYDAIQAGELARKTANTNHEQSEAEKQINGSRKKLHKLASDKRLSDAIGILRANCHITGGQHYAGSRYASLYNQAVRRISLPSTLGNMIGTGGIRGAVEHDTEEAQKAGAETRQAYLEARKILDQQGKITSALVDNVAVFGIIPSMRQLDDLRMGLEALRDHFEIVGRRR